MCNMRWVALVLLFQFMTSALTAESEDEEPSLHIMARSLVYNVGEKKGIFCKGKNLKEPIEWYSPSGKVEGLSSKNDRVFVERQRHETLPLIIISAQLNDSGSWICKSGDLNQTLKIVVGEKVNLSPKEEHLEGESSKSIKFDCVAKGYPPPVVQWYNATGAIIDNRVKYVIKQKGDNHQLEIKNLTHLDAGQYVCQATQEALSSYSMKQFYLTVEHKPIIFNHVTQEMYYAKFTTEEVYAIMNETKNITCSVTAHPPPTFKWTKRIGDYDTDINEEEIIEYNSRETNGTRSYSVLPLKLYSEEDLGSYVCTVSNSKGKVSILFDVQVGNKPSPPDSVQFISATASELIFNVTCSTCNFEDREDMSPDPANLTVLGYSFELVPVRESLPADWNSAVEYKVDIKYPNVTDTLFSVGPLANSTTYHVRVSTRNAAGYSEWIELIDTPTTSFGTTFVLSLALLFITLMVSGSY